MNNIVALLFSFSYFFTPAIQAHLNIEDQNHIKELYGEYVYITLGQDMAEHSLETYWKSGQLELLESAGDISLMKVPVDFLSDASHIAHDTFHRCGGFMLHKSLEEANEELAGAVERSFGKNMLFSDYQINRDEKVRSLISQVREDNIANVIRKLSSYKNRYYQSESGVQSQEWLFKHWESLGSGRADFSVKRWKHADWKQDSIVATLKGKTDDIIVVGGHADSVAGWWRRERAAAPGADDNASGIATTTEIMRILLESGYRPEKTIMFMGYAAEEVGLLGSKEIAKEFKNSNRNVVGVLQLDMTNYNGSEWDIVLINDFTNERQNKFIGDLIDRYLPGVTWGYDKCGYACSDHASWNSQGYPASMPFEAKKGQSNRQIHTSRDTISQSGDNAQHARKFARMGVAFIVELDE